MKDLQLKSQRFRAEREWDWRRLDGLLSRVEGRSAASLSDEELLAIPVLYRAALSSLSVARATSLDHSLIDYLESLSTRAYFVVYGARAGLRQRLVQFFSETWPNAVRDLWRETLAAFVITVAATVVGPPMSPDAVKSPVASMVPMSATSMVHCGDTSALPSYPWNWSVVPGAVTFSVGFDGVMVSPVREPSPPPR